MNLEPVCNLLGCCKTMGWLLYFWYMAKGASVHMASGYRQKLNQTLLYILAVSTLLYNVTVHTVYV